MDTQEAEKEVLQLLKREAERKYPRKQKVLANRLKWKPSKLSRILSGTQEAKLNELLTLCALLAVPLSHVLKVAGS